MAAPREDAPCRIAATRIVGNHRTHADVIERELQRAYRAREVGEIWHGLTEAQQRLTELGIFKGVRFDLVRNNALSRPAWPGRGGGPGGAVADLVVTVEERNWYSLSAEAKAAPGGSGGAGEFLGNLGGALVNPTGHGDRLTVQASEGTLHSRSYGLGYVRPRPFGLPYSARAHARRARHECAAASHAQSFNGGGVELTSHDGRHAFGWTCERRDLHPWDRAARAARGRSRLAGAFPFRLGAAPGAGPPGGLAPAFGADAADAADGEDPAAAAAAADAAVAAGLSRFDASNEIVAEANAPSLKSALHYTFTDDARDSPANPTTGRFFRLSCELAGSVLPGVFEGGLRARANPVRALPAWLNVPLGGDASFARAHAVAQRHYPLPALARTRTETGKDGRRYTVPGAVLSLTGQAGAVLQHSALRRALGLSGGGAFTDGGQNYARAFDRFHLGGPLPLRGFAHRGAGPRSAPIRTGVPGVAAATGGGGAPDRNDAEQKGIPVTAGQAGPPTPVAGGGGGFAAPATRPGDALGGTLVWSAAADLHFPLWRIVRGHAFAAAGALADRPRDLGDARHVRASVGAGLVLPLHVGKVEANCSYVVRQRPEDRTARWQLGLGIYSDP